MTSTPAVAADPADPPRLLRRVLGLFRPYRTRLSLVGGLVVVGALLGIVSPLLVRAVFDRALFGPAGPRLGLLGALVGGLVAVAVASAATDVTSTYLTNIVGQRVLGDLRGRVYAHLQGLSLSFFTRTRGGDLQTRLTNDVAGLQDVITDTASEALEDLVTVVGATIAMLILSWKLTMVSLALLPVFALVAVRVGRRRRVARRRTQAAVGELTSVAGETLSVSGVLLTKLFGRSRDEEARYVAGNREVADLQVHQVMVGARFFTSVQLFFAVTPAAVYLVAGYVLSGGGALTAGTLVAFTTLQARLFQPVGRVLRTATDVSSSLALFGRVFEYLEVTTDVPAPARPVPLDPAGVHGDVVLSDVWFAYPSEAGPDLASSDDEAADTGLPEPAGTWALRGLSLALHPGTVTAVVGPSGAGKTTLAYLLPRLYDPSRGRVTLDGVDLRDLDPEVLSASVGMVSQDTYLFYGTIRDNLRYGRPDATDAEVDAAARAANIADRIASFPQGYDTLVGERGLRLSGGERQRVAIARVLLADPRVLVLDEATSALDTVNERLVQTALGTVTAGRTTLAIAHRLSTVRSADLIVVVDAGQVVEQGRHADLLRLGGLYAELHREQFGADETVEAHCAGGVVLTDGRVLVHNSPPRQPTNGSYLLDPDSLVPSATG